MHTPGGPCLNFTFYTTKANKADDANDPNNPKNCLEDNTAYFGNNVRLGNKNMKASRLECQRSCLEHSECKFWTWGKAKPEGPCYLKTARENVTTGLDIYVSASRDCKLPEG